MASILFFNCDSVTVTAGFSLQSLLFPLPSAFRHQTSAIKSKPLTTV